ncbi:MAG: cation transporter [Candidatus Omnitrophica bacterium]|nr:cation transporter [Candidatus Omnitrophota bacterium]
MKTIGRWLAAAALFGAMAGLGLAEQAVQQQAVTLDIQGMKAGSAAQVEQLLGKMPGVSTVKASDERGEAVVVFDPAQAQQEQFTRAMQEAGYLATFADARFSCPHCGAKYSKDGQCIICDVPLQPNARS